MSSGFPNHTQFSYHLNNLRSNLDFLYFSLSTRKIPVALKTLTTDCFKPSCHTLDNKLTELALVSLEPHSTSHSFRSDSHLQFRGPKHVTSRGCNWPVTCGGYLTIVISSFLSSLTESIDT